MKQINLRYFIILFFIQGILLHAQSKLSKDLGLKYPSINFTTKDGLPSNETYCVFQDSKGYIWIGTDRGLVKFDGYDFKTFTTLDGLTDNVILAINEDKDGNIWYNGLNNLQIDFISPKMEFCIYPHYQSLIDSIDKFDVDKKFGGLHFNQIMFEGNDLLLINNLFGYIILNSNGLKSINLKYHSDEIRIKCIKKDSLSFIYANKFFRYGKIDSSILVYQDNNLLFKRKDNLHIFPTLIKSDSTLYIYDNEVFLKLKGKEQSIQYNKRSCSGFRLNNGGNIFSFYGSMDYENEIFYSDSPDINEPKVFLFKNAKVSYAIKDRNNGIWISTLKRGLLYIPNLKSNVSDINRPIESMYPTDNLIVLSNKGDDLVYDRVSKKIINTPVSPDGKELVKKIGKFSFQGALLINLGLKNKGLFDDHIGAKGIQMLSDSLSYIWGSGILCKLKNKELFIDKIWESYDHILPKQLSLYCFREDSCIYGTVSGLYSYLGDSIVNLHEEENKSVRHIEYFKSNQIIVYSVLGEGIVIKYKDGKKIWITEKDGLLSNFINSLYMDSNEVLWLGTNRGVNTLTVNNNKIEINTIISSSRSLSSPNILQIFYEDSMLYLGTDAGFNIIDLRLEHEQKTPIFINSIQVKGKFLNLKTRNYELPFDSNDIVFNYKAIAFNLFGEINYRYRLLGHSNKWIYSKDLKATYNQLNPGKYIFELEVKNELGDWIKLEYNPELNIAKAFWNTWWFIGTMILLIFSILFGIFYYYISNLKKEKNLIEDKQLLSNELNESRQKALNAQLNPHFVFNSLNSIQNFILTRRTELSSDYLSMFSKLMRFVFENSKQLYVPLSDEIKALKLYLELEKVRHDHQFIYKIEIEPKLATEAVLIPSLLVQPIIENAIWHGLLPKKSKNNQLIISFSTVENYLRIEIKDNGIGRRNSRLGLKVKVIKKQKSSGIVLTKERLTLLQDSVGRKTLFEFIDLMENNEPSGTKVIILIPNNLGDIH